MSKAVGITEFKHESADIDCASDERGNRRWVCRHQLRWTTKQVITCSLWSALFGLACGYAWVLLQIGTYR